MAMVKPKTIAKILREFNEFKIDMLHLNRVAFVEKKGRVIKLIEEDVSIPAIKYEEKIDWEKASNLIYFELKFRDKFFKNCYDFDEGDEDEDDDEDEDE
jgi:hypothetical protein